VYLIHLSVETTVVIRQEVDCLTKSTQQLIRPGRTRFSYLSVQGDWGVANVLIVWPTARLGPLVGECMQDVGSIMSLHITAGWRVPSYTGTGGRGEISLCATVAGGRGGEIRRARDSISDAMPSDRARSLNLFRYDNNSATYCACM